MPSILFFQRLSDNGGYLKTDKQQNIINSTGTFQNDLMV